MDRTIEIVTILGTVRPGSYTGRALSVVEAGLRAHDGVQVTRVDPARMTLGLPGQDVDGADAEAMRDLVSKATGVVLATPEYHGTFAAGAKLVIENLGFPSVLAGKPVGLMGVAAGRIGAIKALEHLRGVMAHVGALPLPTAISIAGVRGMFDDEGRCTDEGTEKALGRVATQMVGYIENHVCPSVTLERMARGDA